MHGFICVLHSGGTPPTEIDHNIIVLELPGVHFDSAEALKKFRPDAESYEAAVAPFQANGDAAELWEELRASSIAGRAGEHHGEVSPGPVEQPARRHGFAGRRRHVL